MIDRYRHCLSANSFSVFRHKKLDGDCVLYSDYAKLKAENDLLWEYFELTSKPFYSTYAALTADGLEIKEVAILPHLLVVEGSRKKLVNEKELAAMRAVCKAVGEWIKHFDTWPDSDNSGSVIRPEDHGHKITMWWADQEELEINIEIKYAALTATREGKENTNEI